MVDCPVKIRAPDCVATPGNTIRKLEPSEEICAWMAAWEPWPTPIIAITQATPMMMPRAVSVERILLRAIAFSPTFRIVRNFSISGLLGGPGDRKVPRQRRGSGDRKVPRRLRRRRRDAP